MRHSILALSVALMVLPAAGQPVQEEGQLLCPVEDVTGLTMLPPLNPPIAGAEVRKALMVCVTFPNMVEHFIPTWLPPIAGEGVEGELEEYVREVSGGAQVLDITLERRPPPFQDLAYMADFNDSHYRDLPGLFGGHGILNAEILYDVLANHSLGGPNYLEQFDVIFMVYNGDPYSENIGGIATLELPFGFPFSGKGYSVRLLNPGYEEGETNLPVNRAHSRWVQVHEYGHLLGLGHSPHSDPEDDCRKKLGRYDPMQHSVPLVSEWDLYPYHVMNLLQIEWIEPGRVTTPENPAGQFYSLGDVRRGGEILKIPIANFPQMKEYFLVLNHQGSDFDVKYPGTGLAVWHIRELMNASWDLEVASGMFDPSCVIQPCPPNSCPADPIAGTDNLDRTGAAGACDFWSFGTFGPDTNPNSNAYQPLPCATQKANSGIALTGILDVGSEMEFNLVLSQPTPAVTFSFEVSEREFLGLDCNAAQELGLPIDTTVFDADGTPLVGVPSNYMYYLLTPTPTPPGTLAFCHGGGIVLAPTTDSTGSAGTTLYKACGGGEYDASFLFLGAVVATDHGKIRTPDLDADGDVDDDDQEIWTNPSGPPEDDIRDFDFDLDVDEDDFDLLSLQMNSELEPDINIAAVSPASGSELAVGTSVLLESSMCVSGGESVLVSYLRYNPPALDILAQGIDLTLFQWPVTPPLGSQELRFVAHNATMFDAVAIVPVTVVAPKIAISLSSYHPLTLNTIGAMGEVNVTLKNNESIAVSDITAELVIPSGALGIMTGPVPAGPYDFTPGRIHAIKWNVVRVSGVGAVQAEVRLSLAGFPEVIKSKTITVFGPTGG
jgi:hypothetical protein